MFNDLPGSISFRRRPSLTNRYSSRFSCESLQFNREITGGKISQAGEYAFAFSFWLFHSSDYLGSRRRL